MKKGAALLIVVLFIAIFGGVAVTMTRTGLLNGIFTNNAIDAMAAEEASQSGLEVGLLHFKLYGNIAWNTDGCYDLSTGGDAIRTGCGTRPPATPYAQISITKTNGDLVHINSVGHYGYVVKKHVLTQIAEKWNTP